MPTSGFRINMFFPMQRPVEKINIYTNICYDEIQKKAIEALKVYRSRCMMVINVSNVD